MEVCVNASFKVVFYEGPTGSCPPLDFLDSLDTRMRAKVVSELTVLQEVGNQLREPYSKPLGNGIYELRCKLGSNIVRLLYFFVAGHVIVVTSGFVKKGRKTPRDEIALAQRRRADYLRRQGL